MPLTVQDSLLQLNLFIWDSVDSNLPITVFPHLFESDVTCHNVNVEYYFLFTPCKILVLTRYHCEPWALRNLTWRRLHDVFAAAAYNQT